MIDKTYDWEGDHPINHLPETPSSTSCMSGALPEHPSAKVSHPGTFSGLVEKIPYLKELGITCVELIPVMAFDEQDLPIAISRSPD